jgi:hypothetical protein
MGVLLGVLNKVELGNSPAGTVAAASTTFAFSALFKAFQVADFIDEIGVSPFSAGIMGRRHIPSP